MTTSRFAALFIACGFAQSTLLADDFALRDGDTVVFLGDSITAARTYGKIIENYTLLRFPDRNVRFYNAGLGGDTAAGSLKRIDRDVFDRGATAVVVAFGTNDIGWGMKANDEAKQKYLDAVREIVTRAQAKKVRVYLCSAAITSQDPDAAEAGFLQAMCDEGMKLARDLGEHSIDVQRSMRGVQRRVLEYSAKAKEKVTLHAADGVHLNDLGQLTMAWAILKGLGAPADVSSCRIDAANAKVVEAVGCRVTDVGQNAGGLSFTRLDDGLPFNGGLFYALNFRFVPVPSELNGYRLQIDGLAPGRYDVTAEDVKIGEYTAAVLARGINIASATANAWHPGSPWAAQAVTVAELTDARHNLDQATMLARLYGNVGGTADELKSPAAEADARLTQLQRDAARPRPYHFVVRPTTDKSKTPQDARQ